MNAPVEHDVRVGDIVRRGKGKVQWRVDEFRPGADGEPWAILKPVVGYTNTWAPVRVLTVLSRGEDQA